MKLYGVTLYDDLIDLPVDDGCVYLTREAAQRHAERMTYEDDGVRYWATVHSLDPCWDVSVCGPFDEDKPDWVRFIDYACKIKRERDGARTENAKLRENLEFERSENGWAREFLDRMGRKCGTKDCPSLVAYVDKLESENAKMRQLIMDMYKAFMHGNCYRWCEYKEPCNYISDGKCQWYDRMRELGIES